MTTSHHTTPPVVYAILKALGITAESATNREAVTNALLEHGWRTWYSHNGSGNDAVGPLVPEPRHAVLVVPLANPNTHEDA